MTDVDPLAGLDDVPWADLQHSYGTADDVPGKLRAMQAGLQEGPYQPIDLLWNNIVHQGTRSEAAVYTVPFLVRMALDPRMADRHDVIGLLAAIAIGLDNNYLPNGYDPTVGGEDELRDLTGEVTQWIAEAEDETEHKERTAQGAEMLRKAEAVALCHHTVRDSLPALTDLLNADAAELRAAAANLLAWFPDFTSTSTPLLTSFVASESAPAAAATGIVALGLLGEPTVVPFIRQYLDSAFDELRWASAFALTRFGVTDSAVTDALIKAIAQPPTQSKEMPFLGGDYLGLATIALAETQAATTPQAIDAILAGLANDTDSQSYSAASTLFALAFPADPSEVPQSFSDLSQIQQRVLVEREPFPWPANATYALRQWNIPTGQPDLRAYLGLGSYGQ
jgi:hypothetical protein